MTAYFTLDYSMEIHFCLLVLVIGPYTKAANAATIVLTLPWMGPKSTTSFILIVRSFTCLPNHDMGPAHLLLAHRRNVNLLVLVSLESATPRSVLYIILPTTLCVVGLELHGFVVWA